MDETHTSKCTITGYSEWLNSYWGETSTIDEQPRTLCGLGVRDVGIFNVAFIDEREITFTCETCHLLAFAEKAANAE